MLIYTITTKPSEITNATDVFRNVNPTAEVEVLGMIKGVVPTTIEILNYHRQNPTRTSHIVTTLPTAMNLNFYSPGAGFFEMGPSFIPDVLKNEIDQVEKRNSSRRSDIIILSVSAEVKVQRGRICRRGSKNLHKCRVV